MQAETERLVAEHRIREEVRGMRWSGIWGEVRRDLALHPWWVFCVVSMVTACAKPQDFALAQLMTISRIMAAVY